MDPTERRTVPVTALLTPSEAAFVREVCWQTRRPLSGWLREVAISAAGKLARQQQGASEKRASDV